jgi:iron complex outermembrane receptor protein
MRIRKAFAVFGGVHITAALAVVGVAPVLSEGAWAADDIAEIIVTTRKREEALQDVPVAITAFSREAIESAGINSLDDIAALTPGLNFFNPVGEFLPVPVIRGVAPTDIFGENNAAIYVDGVYVSGREGLNFSQLDLERIEINKGPQAALYGRTAFSGAINYITARPTDEFGVKTELKLGNDGIFAVKGIVSGPITDSLKGRLAASFDDWDGSYENPLGSNDVGGYRYVTTQGSLLWDVSDDLSVLLRGYYSDDEIDESATTGLTANCENTNFADPPGTPPRLANVCGEIPSLSGVDIAKLPSAVGEERELTRLSLEIDWNLGPGTLTAITGYSDTEQRARGADGNRDLGETLPFVYCNILRNIPFPGTCAGFQRFTTGLLQVAPEPDTTEEWSQELRWSSAIGDRIRYDAGFYYFDRESDGRELGVVATQPLPADFVGFGPFVTIIPGFSFLPIGTDAFGPWFQPGGDPNAGRLVERENTDSWSVFGAVDYDVTETVTGRVELRYANEEKEVRGFNEDNVFTRLGEEDWDLWAWRATVKWDFADAWNVYGAVGYAEKPGKLDINIADVQTDPGPPPVVEERTSVNVVDSEENTTYEIGLKGTAFDRVTVAAAIYYTDWKDIILPQVLENDPQTGLPFEQPETFDLNAGSADIWGIEIEASTRLTDTLRASAGFSYTDSELDDAQLVSFEEFPSFAPDGDVSGNQLLRQPEVMGSVTLEYERPAFGEHDFYARTDVTYQDKVYNGNDNQGYYPAHTYVNLLAGLRGPTWDVDIWVRNLFEDDNPVGGFRDVWFNNTSDVTQSLPPASSPSADFFPWRYTVTHPRLRTFGLTARWKFGGLQ